MRRSHRRRRARMGSGRELRRRSRRRPVAVAVRCERRPRPEVVVRGRRRRAGLRRPALGVLARLPLHGCKPPGARPVPRPVRLVGAHPARPARAAARRRPVRGRARLRGVLPSGAGRFDDDAARPRVAWHDLGDGVLRYDIRATALCWQMVRSIVGTLVDVGTGKKRPGDLMGILRLQEPRPRRPARATRGPVPVGGRLLRHGGAFRYGEARWRFDPELAKQVGRRARRGFHRGSSSTPTSIAARSSSRWPRRRSGRGAGPSGCARGLTDLRRRARPHRGGWPTSTRRSFRSCCVPRRPTRQVPHRCRGAGGDGSAGGDAREGRRRMRGGTRPAVACGARATAPASVARCGPASRRERRPGVELLAGMGVAGGPTTRSCCSPAWPGSSPACSRWRPVSGSRSGRSGAVRERATHRGRSWPRSSKRSGRSSSSIYQANDSIAEAKGLVETSWRGPTSPSTVGARASASIPARGSPWVAQAHRSPPRSRRAPPVVSSAGGRGRHFGVLSLVALRWGRSRVPRRHAGRSGCAWPPSAS